MTNSSNIRSICIILYASLHDSCLRWINGKNRCSKIYFIRYAHSTVFSRYRIILCTGYEGWEIYMPQLISIYIFMIILVSKFEISEREKYLYAPISFDIFLYHKTWDKLRRKIWNLAVSLTVKWYFSY